MQKSKIEWCDFSVNPIKGLCPVACSYCYARKMYKRFHWDEIVKFDEVGYHKDDWGLETIKTPSRIFVGSTMELFGHWIEQRWLEVLFQVMRR